MKIVVNHVRCYGKDRYYPFCDTSHMICKLLGRLSLTKEQLDIIKAYKCEVEIERSED